jgi:hypothetical protein
LIVTALITAGIGGLCVGGMLFAFTRGELEGSGNVVSEQRPIAGVSRVTIEGPGLLIVAQGESEGLSITTDDNILEKIETDVDGDELAISYELSGFTTASRIQPSEEIRFELTVRDLARIEIDGSASVESDGLQGDRLELIVNGAGDAFLRGLRVDEFAVTVNGASTIDVAGTVDRQEIELNGSANFRGANLASREAVIEVNGEADATVRVSETLDVTIEGRGLVEYIGDPRRLPGDQRRRRAAPDRRRCAGGCRHARHDPDRQSNCHHPPDSPGDDRGELTAPPAPPAPPQSRRSNALMTARCKPGCNSSRPSTLMRKDAASWMNSSGVSERVTKSIWSWISSSSVRVSCGRGGTRVAVWRPVSGQTTSSSSTGAAAER